MHTRKKFEERALVIGERASHLMAKGKHLTKMLLGRLYYHGLVEGYKAGMQDAQEVLLRRYDKNSAP